MSVGTENFTLTFITEKLSRDQITDRCLRLLYLTSDGELSGGIAQRDELLLAAVMVDNDVHGVGAQRDVVCTDGQGGGGAVCHLPVLTCQMSSESLVSTRHTAAPPLQISGKYSHYHLMIRY